MIIVWKPSWVLYFSFQLWWEDRFNLLVKLLMRKFCSQLSISLINFLFLALKETIKQFGNNWICFSMFVKMDYRNVETKFIAMLIYNVAFTHFNHDSHFVVTWVNIFQNRKIPPILCELVENLYAEKQADDDINEADEVMQLMEYAIVYLVSFG